jgi:SAM-dependent methyltransferase
MLAHRQDTYWWHRARRALSRTLLARFGLAWEARWLDLGCGPGGNLQMLGKDLASQVIGLDLSPLALQLAKVARPNACLVRADLNSLLPFKDASFDLVTIYNVLYHQWIASEAAVLREVWRILAPGGLLLLTEPAFPVLARGMDVAAMARRRYLMSDFDELFHQTGFESLFGGYFTSFGYPLLRAAMKIAGERKTEPSPEVDMRPLPSLVNWALLAAATLENLAICANIRMPFGTTLIRIARRPRA